MRHTYFCEKCDAEWHTYCCSHFGREHTPEEKLEERRRWFSQLCHGCWEEFKKNPTPLFELAFSLYQKNEILSALIWHGTDNIWGKHDLSTLDGVVESMLIQTPEKIEKDRSQREKRMAENKIWNEKWESDFKYFQENGKWPNKEDE